MKRIAIEWNGIKKVRDVPDETTREEVIAQIVRDMDKVAAKTVVPKGPIPPKESTPVEIPSHSPEDPRARPGYTVGKASGIGWYDVTGPDGKAINDKSMRKRDADKLAREKNAEAASET